MMSVDERTTTTGSLESKKSDWGERVRECTNIEQTVAAKESAQVTALYGLGCPLCSGGRQCQWPERAHLRMGHCGETHEAD